MHSTERPQFEAELEILFGGFPTFLTPPRVEAYWRGLQHMTISTFKRCVMEALGEGGTDKLPTVNALWQISKRLRTSVPAQRQAETVAIHPLQRVANGAVFKLLRDKGPTSDESLTKIIALKNRIVGQAPADAEHDELRDVVIGAIEKLWEPMSAAALEAHIAKRFATSQPHFASGGQP